MGLAAQQEVVAQHGYEDLASKNPNGFYVVGSPVGEAVHVAV